MQPVQIVNEGFIAARARERSAARARKKKPVPAAAVESAQVTVAGRAADTSEGAPVVVKFERPDAHLGASGRVWSPPARVSVQERLVKHLGGAKKAKPGKAPAGKRKYASELRLLYASLIGVIIGAVVLALIVLMYGVATGSLSGWIAAL